MATRRNIPRPEPLILRPLPQVCLPPISGILSGDIQHSARALQTARSQILSAGSQLFSAGLKSANDALLSARDGLLSAKQVVETIIEVKLDALAASIHTALKTAKTARHGLITFDDLPDPWRINPHITKGYRFYETQTECVHSIFHFTNESVNIWSHAFGIVCILVVGLFVFPFTANFSRATTLDMIFVGLFLVAAAKCMICSCTYHTMNSIADQDLNKFFTCVDYTGISFIIAASLMSTEHIAFNCHNTSWWIYISNTALLGIVGMCIPWHPFFRGNAKAWLRVSFYGGSVTTGLIPPFLHLTYLYGLSWSTRFYAPLLAPFLTMVAGAWIYANKFPEKFIPGKFDFVGNSHNIWHFAVLGGILLYCRALIQMFDIGLEMAGGECRPL